MRILCLSVVTVAWAGAAGHAQVITEMTPERIREAIALGQRESPNLYQLKGPRGWGDRRLRGRVYGYFDTPFLRVAMLTALARKLNDPPIPEDMFRLRSRELLPPGALPGGPERLIDPYVTVVIHPAKPTTTNTPVVKVHRTAFECAGRRIEPISIEESDKISMTAFGVTRDVTGIEAVFPLDVLAAPCRVIVTTDQGPSVLHTDEQLLAKIR